MSFKHLATTVATLALCAPALAQDHAHGTAAPAEPLPAICGTAEADVAPAEPMGHEMDAAHADLMAGMEEMHTQMMTGMMAADVDVAFVCGMIPHHRGAIAMARAELEHGDDPWARQLAQQIIDSQEAEVAAMLAWLNRKTE